MSKPAGGPPPRRKQSLNGMFLVGLARAFAGAIIFGLPMFMTMEMWALGFYMERARLIIFMLITIPLLVGLSHYVGFDETFDVKEDVVDAFVAYAVGFVASVAVLLLIGVVRPGMSSDEVMGKIALQAIPAAIGALLARSELAGNGQESKEKHRPSGYFGELFLMAVGALFLAFNLAPTEEMVLIAHHLTSWQPLILVIVSLIIMHAFVYAVNFTGQADVPEGTPLWRVFLRYTVVGYAAVLGMSLFALWVFGQTDGASPQAVAFTTVVLGFPGAIGAAAARLIL